MNKKVNKSLIINEIKSHLGFKKDIDFADFLGIKHSTLSNWHTRNMFDIELIVSKCKEINANYLITGKGSMLLTEQPNNTAPIAVNTSNTQGIPFIPADAAAGYFGGEVQVMGYEVEHYNIPLFGKCDFLMPIKGTSMMPTYQSGDVVACKKLESFTFFQYGKAYILNTSQGVIIKRLLQGKDDEHVLICSDNKKQYPPFELHKSEITHLAIVVGTLRLE